MEARQPYQGLYVDPKRDVVGAYFSTNPLTRVWDRSGGYIGAAAKLLAGGWRTQKKGNKIMTPRDRRQFTVAGEQEGVC